MEQKTIGTLIRQARLARRLTQKELAERLHVTDKAVSKWERDVCRPDIALLEPLSQELGLSIWDLLGVEEPERGLRNLVDYSVAEVRRKKGQVNRRWAGLLGALLLLAWGWLLMSGYRFSPEAAARYQLMFRNGETAEVVLRETIYDYDAFLFDAGDTYHMTFVRKAGPLWQPMGVDAYGPKRDDRIEYLGGATFEGSFGFMLLCCHDPNVETVTVNLGGKTTITQAVGTDQIEIFRWPTEMQRPWSSLPTAVACDADGEVLYHLDMLQTKENYALHVYPGIYHWWEGPEGTYPGYEEDLKNR